MNIKNFSAEGNTNYDYHFNQPMQTVELRLIIAKNPNLINSLDKSFKKTLIKKNKNLHLKN